MIFYFLGNINGNRISFRRVWEPIRDYMSSPDSAVIFPVGNFGLGNQDFLDYVSKSLDGRCHIYTGGGNAAHEGWVRRRPPIEEPFEIRPGIHIQPYGSSVTFGKWRFCFLGRGSTFYEDWFPLPKPEFFDDMPSERERLRARNCFTGHVDVVLSFLPPSNVMKSILATAPDDDARRRKLRDPVLAPLDDARMAAEEYAREKNPLWWFYGGLGVSDDRTSRSGVRYISLTPFITGSKFVASLETVHLDEDDAEREELGDFCL